MEQNAEQVEVEVCEAVDAGIETPVVAVEVAQDLVGAVDEVKEEEEKDNA